MELEEQNILIKSIVNTCTSRAISQWQKTVQILPPNIFCFCRRYLISFLPTIENLARWRKIVSENCSLCGIYKANTETRCLILFERPQQRTVHLEAQLGPIHNMSTPIISNEKWEQAIGRPYWLKSTSSLFESSRPDACL